MVTKIDIVVFKPPEFYARGFKTTILKRMMTNRLPKTAAADAILAVDLPAFSPLLRTLASMRHQFM